MALDKLAVILPTYRQPELLLLTMRDLSLQDYPPYAWELVMIDDGGRDRSTEIALMNFSHDINITVKRLAHGGTYSHGKLFNEMIRLADPESSVIVHVEDVRVRTDYLRQHAKWHRTDSLFLVTGPMCESTTETFDPVTCGRWQLMQMSGQTAQAYRCCFQAAFAKSLSYSRELLDRLADDNNPEPFDASMSGWGCHETEFAFRACGVGASCVYDVACGVYHPPHNSRDEVEYRHIDRGQILSEDSARNIEYFCRKHNLDRLPDWMVGEPLAAPPDIL